MGLVLDYIVALTNLYGIVHKEKVVEIYNSQNEDKIDISQIETIMKENDEDLIEYFSVVYGDYFVHETILVFDEFEEEWAAKQGKPYYIPVKNELLKYKDEFYFERSKEYKALVRYVTKHFMKGNREKAEEMCEDIQIACEMGAPPSIIFEEFDRKDVAFDNEEQVSEVMDLVMNLANNTRIWTNNGHTPIEIRKIHERSHTNVLAASNTGSESPSLKVISGGQTKKVGRNDPCPCGSGKKYKKCCL